MLGMAGDEPLPARPAQRGADDDEALFGRRRAVDPVSGEGDEAVRAEERGGCDDATRHDRGQAASGSEHAGRQQPAQARYADRQPERPRRRPRPHGFLNCSDGHERADAGGGKDRRADSRVSNHAACRSTRRRASAEP